MLFMFGLVAVVIVVLKVLIETLFFYRKKMKLTKKISKWFIILCPFIEEIFLWGTLIVIIVCFIVYDFLSAALLTMLFVLNLVDTTFKVKKIKGIVEENNFFTTQ